MRRSGSDEADEDFRAFMAARAPGLRRTAYGLCGDWHHAEDLVQTAFTRAYASWGRVQAAGNAESYLRAVLTNAYIDETRRGRWRERPTADVPDRATDDGHGSVDDRDALVAALAEVPPRQRVCLVLRFLDDRSVDEVAAILGCQPGTVKSQTARGLAALRAALLVTAPDLVPRLDDVPPHDDAQPLAVGHGPTTRQDRTL